MTKDKSFCKISFANFSFVEQWFCKFIYYLLYHVQRVLRVHDDGCITDDTRSQLQRRDLQEWISGEIIAGYFDLQFPGGVRVVHYDDRSGLLFSYKRFEIDRVYGIWQFATRSGNFNAQRFVFFDL